MLIDQRVRTRDGWPAARGGGLDQAQLALVFGSTAQVLDPATWTELAGLYPGARLVGCSTAGELADVDLYDHALVATAMRLEHGTIEVAAVQLGEAVDSAGLGALLASRLPATGLVHVLVISEGLKVNGSALVAGLRAVLPATVGLSGGLSGDGAAFERTAVCLDGPTPTEQIVAIGWYGARLQIGCGSRGGWEPAGNPRRRLPTARPRSSVLNPSIDSTFAPAGAPAGTPTVLTAPNQLWNAVVIGTKIYVPAIAAAPAAPTNFQTNVHAVVYVGDLAGRAEDRGLNGTMVLPRLVRDQIPGTAKQFLADIVDLDFVGTEVAYVLSRGADTVQRIELDPVRGPRLGTAQSQQIELNTTPAGSPGPCHTPTGIVTAHVGARAFVNCWVTRSLGVIDLSQQALIATVGAATIGAAERDAQLGRRFFFTGRGRWSNSGWSGCGSCHPDGLSDNITWSFAAGPRQSTALDGSYSHGPGPQKQRVFNWTGIFDEMHDFERNTRGVSGGKGAVTRPDPAIPGAVCGNLAQEVQVTISNDGLGRSVKLDQDLAGNCTDDWDKVDAYARTVRPNRPRTVRVRSRGRRHGCLGPSSSAACSATTFWSAPAAPGR